MKKIYFLVLAAFTGFGAQAQSLTQANHAPANNDQYMTFQCDSASVTPGAGGAGLMWNYGSIATRSSVVNSYTASSTTNTSYPGSDIAVYSSTSNISYYKSSSTELKYYGGNVSVGGIAATLQYTSPAIFAAYPMSMSTTSTATTGGSLNVLGNAGTFSGSSNVTADATGTLVLPSGTYTNVIRVVTSQTINFTASFATGTVTQVNYDYYAAGTKYPMFTISTSTIGTNLSAPSSQTLVTRQNPSTVGVKENSTEVISLNVYPNPSTSFVNFATDSKNASYVAIFDVTGKMVEKQNLNDGKLNLNVSAYNTGIYIYKVMNTGNQTLKAGKITVTH